MITIVIICSVLAVLCFIIGLLLSKAGSSSGLTNITGQDLEIFKKTKDRGWTKWLQVIMFIFTIILIIITIVIYFVGK